MIETWKKKISLRYLSLEHKEPIIFILSQWQKEKKPSIIYLIYRWIIALIFFITLVFSIIDRKHPDASPAFRAKWLIYLTNWGYTTCTLQALLSAITLSICILTSNLQGSALKFYKVYWMLNVIATDIAFGITTLYWSLIYDEKSMELNAINFFVHAINSVLMMMDLFVVAHPIRLLHCCYPVVFGICYAVFSVIFYAAGGISREGQVYIYNILDWRKPGVTSVVCLAVLGFIMIVHIICWGLHKFRLWIHSKCYPEGENDCNGFSIEEKESNMVYVNESIGNQLV